MKAKTEISQTPFMVVKRGSAKCPICNWRAAGGPRGGAGLAMRIHCYREHGLRLRFGARNRRVSDSGPIDLDAEVASHMWIVESVMDWRRMPPSDDIEAVRSDAAMGLMEAILTWNGKRGFVWYAKRWIAKIVAGDHDRVLNTKREAPSIPLAAATPAVADAEPDRLEADDEIAKMMSLLGSNPLCDTWRRVIDARFPASGKGATLSEVSLAIGLTKERVRQIEIEALAKLRGAMDPDAPPRPRPKPKRDIPPEPGHFVVVATRGAVRHAALDETAVMRLSEPGGEVSVFTDRRTAFVMANRLRGTLSGKSGGVRVRRIRAVEDGDDVHGLTVRLVHRAPTRTNFTSMTVDAIRGVLASAGRPLTLAEIADALLSDDSFMEKRFPDGQGRSAATMSNMAANAVRYRTGFTVARGAGRKRNLYAIT